MAPAEVGSLTRAMGMEWLPIPRNPCQVASFGSPGTSRFRTLLAVLAEPFSDLADPLAGRRVLAGPNLAIDLHLDDVVGDHVGIRHPARRHEHADRAAHRDIARHPGREPERRHPLRGADEVVAEAHRHLPNSSASEAGVATPPPVG